MQTKKFIISFFLLFTAILFVNSSFAARPGTSRLSHFISVHKDAHSQSTGNDFLLLSDIQTERCNDDYNKRLALFRLAIGKSLLAHQLADSFSYASSILSLQPAAHSNPLLSCRLSHIYPFHFFW